MKKIVLVLIAALFLACEGEEDRMVNCSNILCVVDQFRITYKNAAGDPLIGTTFVQDSFKLSSSNQILYLKPQPIDNFDNLIIKYGDLESGVDYELELSAVVGDTLNFTFSTMQADCCTDSSMQSLQYNGTTVAAELEDFYILIK